MPDLGVGGAGGGSWEVGRKTELERGWSGGGEWRDRKGAEDASGRRRTKGMKLGRNGGEEEG